MSDSDPSPSNSHDSGAPAAQDRFLTLGDVQRIFGISRMTVWRWINEQGLKVVRIGNVTRIRQSDLDRFVTRHEQVETERQRSAVEPLASR